MDKNCLNNRKGFTLAELLAVIAILGVISAIAVPSFSYMYKRWEKNYCTKQKELLYNNISEFFQVGSTGDYNMDQTSFITRKTIGTMFSSVKSGTYGNHWLCGSYDPETDTWYDSWYCEEDSYYYPCMKQKTENDPNELAGKVYDKVCNSPGEYFLRYIYEYGDDVSSSDCVFPTDTITGCKIHVEFTETGIDEYYDDLIDKAKKELLSDAVLANKINGINAEREAAKRDKNGGENLPIGYLTIKCTNPNHNDDNVVLWIK